MTAPDPAVHIVDDDASFLAATARLLRASGFVVRTFCVGGGIPRAAERRCAGLSGH